MDRHQLRCGSSAVAVTQFNTDDGATPTKRSAAQPAMEAAGNFVLVFAFGVAIATHSWFAPLLIEAPLVAMVCARHRVPAAFYNPSLSFAMVMRRRIAIRDASRSGSFSRVPDCRRRPWCVRWSVRGTWRSQRRP